MKQTQTTVLEAPKKKKVNGGKSSKVIPLSLFIKTHTNEK